MSAAPSDLPALAEACGLGGFPVSDPGARVFSIWEITSWHLPMAPEHLRRVLAEHPDLPQGEAGVEGGTRWFSAADIGALRRHFAAGPRGKRYRLDRPTGARAPLVTLAGPQGASGRTLALAHLATAAALAGWRVLVLDADPGGRLAALLGDRFRSETSPLPDPAPSGPLGLIARAAARQLRRTNSARLDMGEPPLPMDDRLSAALGLTAAALIRPSRWPGLDLMVPLQDGLLADPLIAAWRTGQRSWQPWRALAEALDEEGLRGRYDLIFCDTGRGLGPMALAALISADVLLAPVPLTGEGPGRLAEGLAALSAATTEVQAEAQGLARALGQPGPAYDWQRIALLPTRSGADGPERLAGFAAKLGPLAASLLPAALPEVALPPGRQFYDLDYRDIGRQAYTPPREACEAAFRGLAALIGRLWHETPV
ncbi:MAG: hypothetical protein E6Q73_16230 [Pseudorhodobacter sp.]|nr:MAG: hypothetical protein E6Q73_16230 [Pseudorhodobacter sp.]